ncbi:hypothetical protein MFIFM68171_09543 [Madurella fahalii]|uniref:Cytochrome P450 n=1 Tax=Madurella fahalii TaxID=1157608 RepID=A0ABQ0GNI5_9PEZI
MSFVPSSPSLTVTAKAVILTVTSQPFLAAIGFAVAVYIAHSCLTYARLRHFPGPKLARWTRIPLVLWHLSGRVHLKLQEISETHGPLALVAPGVLLTSDSELMRRMAAPRSRYKRSNWYMAFRFNPDKDHIGSHRDNEVHAQLKLKIAPGYSGREIVDLEEKVDANIVALVKLIEKSYLSAPTETKAFDLAQKIQYFTADTIGDIAFGKAIGFLENDTDMYDYLKTSAEGFPFFMVLSLFPWLMYVLGLDTVKKYLPSAGDSVGMGRIMGLAHEIVEKRYPPKEGELHQDMLGSFIRHGLTREEAESESVMQILAGAETTATAIRMTLFYIYSNPRILFKLRAEIEKARPSSPITNAEATNLPYLQAVIKEGIRIYPSITGIMLKDVPPEGDTYNGKFIPGGSAIGYSVMGMLMDKKTWGDDAKTFRPERFLEGSEGELQVRNAAVEATFGYGRWKCLGRNIAQLELNKAITEIVRTFDLSVVYPTNPFKNYSAGVQIQWDMWMRATLARD